MSLLQFVGTSGYFYAVGYALCAWVVTCFQKPAVSALKKGLSHLALFAFLYIWMFLNDGAQNGRFIATMAVAIAAIYFSILYAFKDRVKAGFYCIKAFIYGEFSASMSWQFFFYLAQKREGLQNGYAAFLLSVVTFSGLAALIFLVERRLYKDNPDVDLMGHGLFIGVLTAAIVYVVSNLAYLDPDGMFSGSYARDIFAMHTLVDLCGAALLYALHSQLNEMQLRIEKEALHNIMQTQYQAYQISRESIDMVNQKYHDLKHQIVLLRSEGTSEKAEAYLSRLEKEIAIYETQHQTGNRVLDAILTSKSIYCGAHGIELKFMIDGKLLGFMDDMEISALFGNMLDNAIESVERLDDPQKRLIRLYVAGEKHFLCIRMENYCEEQLRFEDGMPVTTKRDRRYHGFGMKSMLRTVTKYGGSMLTKQSNNWFELKILIPLA